MRSPVSALLDQFNKLNEVERNVFLDLVDPQPEAETPAKKASKKRGPRSPRAQSISSAIATARDGRADSSPVVLDGTPCVYQYSKDSAVNPGMICGRPADDGVHDSSMGYAGYHAFEAGKAKKAAK